MGNRAVITKDRDLYGVGVYLHWNGGRDSETRALFEEGYDLTRELDILYHASALMKQVGLKKGHDDLFDYCVAKEDAYAKKVHAANLEERIPNAEGVEDQK